MKYSKEEIEAFKNEIITHISNGLSLNKALLDNKHLPNRTTVYTWLNEEHDNYDDDFFNNYVRAREIRADKIFDEILEIADDSTGDSITTSEGKEVFNGEFAARSRIKIDARKWVLGRMKPKKYGDKIDITSKGEKLSQAQITVNHNDKKLDLSVD